MQLDLEPNGNITQAHINLMITFPEPEDLDAKGVKKEDKTLQRQRRGVTFREQMVYNQALAREEERFHREAVDRYYKVYRPKRNAPSYNPFMTARAIGTKAEAVV